jgi:hypothetical protein
MQRYTLKAELNNSITTVSIPARNDECAMALSAREIASKFVSDRRWEKGRITLMDPDNEIVRVIDEEE